MAPEREIITSETVLLIDVHVIGHRRPVTPATVEMLKHSIAELGLRTPITVRYDANIADPESGEVIGGYALIAGRHRVEACRALGWERIPAVIRDCTEIDAELWEIDENLCRADLSPSERAQCTARRKVLYEARHPEAKAGVVRANAANIAMGHDVDDKLSSTFTQDTVKKTGANIRQVQRDAERGEKVIEEALNLIRGTSLDTGVYLDKLKRLTPNDQVTAVERDLLAARRRLREAKSAKETKLAPEPLSDFEAEEKQYAALVSAWNRSGTGARERFREYIDTPVFDRGAAA